jgi:hypothetical protein
MVGMPGPTPAFASVVLDVATIAPGEILSRVYYKRFPDPLGVGKTPSRFSDPRRRVPENRFGVVYLGESLKVCFLEAVLRDQRNGHVGDYPIDEIEIDARVVSQITPRRPLRLIDLTADGAIRMGIPTDVVRASNQRLARAWSVAFHDHPAAIDGIRYPSRLNGEINLAIYDRAIPALTSLGTVPLLTAADLPQVLDDLLAALI